MEHKKCVDCGMLNVRQYDRCIRCDFQHQKNVSAEKRRAVKRKTFNKICEECKCQFVTESHQSKVCSKNCREIFDNKKANARWESREFSVAPRKDDDKIEYCLRVGKRPTAWMKKFNAVRG